MTKLIKRNKQKGVITDMFTRLIKAKDGSPFRLIHPACSNMINN